MKRLELGSASLTLKRAEGVAETVPRRAIETAVTVVIGDYDIHGAFAQPNVRADLPREDETQAFQSADSVAARHVAREFHAGANTGSLTKRKRIWPGSFRFPKWHDTASRTFSSNSQRLLP